MGRTRGGGLPASFRELEYLESTGTQYIDSLIVPSNGYSIWVKFIDDSGTVCGVALSGNPTSYFAPFCRANSGAVYFYYNSYHLLGGNIARNTLYEARLETTSDSATATVCNSGGSVISSGTAVCVIHNSKSIYLFGIHGNNDALIEPFTGRIFSVQIYNNSTRLGDFIPALCPAGKSYVDGNTGQTVTAVSDKPGLCDRVSGRFFVNQGTGEFQYQ